MPGFDLQSSGTSVFLSCYICGDLLQSKIKGIVEKREERLSDLQEASKSRFQLQELCAL